MNMATSGSFNILASAAGHSSEITQPSCFQTLPHIYAQHCPVRNGNNHYVHTALADVLRQHCIPLGKYSQTEP